VVVLPDPTVVLSAVAQSNLPGTGLSPGLAAVARFVGVAIGSSLAVGLAVGIAPEFTRERVDELRADSGVALASELLVGVVVSAVLLLVGATGVGLLATGAAVFGLVALGTVGTAVATLWVGSVLATTDDTVGRAAVGTAVLATLGAVPLVGELTVPLVSVLGAGVVTRASYEAYRS